MTSLRELSPSLVLVVFISLVLAPCLPAADFHKYFCLGNKDDVQTRPTAVIAVMGGDSELDEAFRWLCNKGTAGIF